MKPVLFFCFFANKWIVVMCAMSLNRWMNFFLLTFWFLQNYLGDIGIVKGNIDKDSSRKLEIMYESVLIRELE